jgi:2OG-Fe(II) oxygenase superfamily
MKHESPAQAISIYTDVFTEQTAANFIDKIEKEIKSGFSDLSWTQSSVGEIGQVTQHRTSLSCSMIPLMPPYEPTALSESFTNDIRQPIEMATADYRLQHLLPQGAHEPYGLLKYIGGGEYHAHHDHAPDNSRVWSMVAFILSPESGGQLEFPLFDISVEPKCGTVVCFPSNFPYQHIAHPVTDGIKYSLVTWFK